MNDEGAAGARIALWVIVIGSLVGLGWLVVNLSPASFGSWFIVALAWGVWTAVWLFVVQLGAVILGVGSALTRRR